MEYNRLVVKYKRIGLVPIITVGIEFPILSRSDDISRIISIKGRVPPVINSTTKIDKTRIFYTRVIYPKIALAQLIKPVA